MWLCWGTKNLDFKCLQFGYLQEFEIRGLLKGQLISEWNFGRFEDTKFHIEIIWPLHLI